MAEGKFFVTLSGTRKFSLGHIFSFCDFSHFFCKFFHFSIDKRLQKY